LFGSKGVPPGIRSKVPIGYRQACAKAGDGGEADTAARDADDRTDGTKGCKRDRMSSKSSRPSRFLNDLGTPL
jgi:hypothetical protein